MLEETAPGCLTRILQLFGIRIGPRVPPSDLPHHAVEPYYAVEALLSPAEINLYHVLRTVVNDRATLCPKVGLGDLFFVKTGNRSRNTSYRNRIDRKHVDFLLCHPQTLSPLGGIELDDASHARADRVARDAFVDGVFSAAGLPLVHVTAQRAYSLDTLRDQLRDAGLLFGPASPVPEATPQPVTVTAPSSAPLCPKCGTPMVLRTAKRGSHAGERFWACPNYSQCRAVLPIDEP